MKKSDPQVHHKLCEPHLFFSTIAQFGAGGVEMHGSSIEGEQLIYFGKIERAMRSTPHSAIRNARF